MIYIIAYVIVMAVVFRLVFPFVLRENTWSYREPEVGDVAFSAFLSFIISLFWGALLPIALFLLLVWVIIIPEKHKPEGTTTKDWVENAKEWLAEREEADKARKAEKQAQKE